MTGRDITFLEGIETGRKSWNLDNAVWVLQGRHRSMVHFADNYYTDEYPGDERMAISGMAMYAMPTYLQYPGLFMLHWDYRDVSKRHLTKGVFPHAGEPTDDFEEFKTRFYTLQGWDPNSGLLKRSTLESIGLGYVADVLGARGKIGV